MHHDLQSGTSGASFFSLLCYTSPFSSKLVLHSWPGLSWCEHVKTTHALACTHSKAAQCSSRLPVEPSDVWRCSAWFRSRARGDKPLHLTSPISCSQGRSGGEQERARAIKTEHVKRERERGRAMGTVTYIFCAAPLWGKIQYHTAALRAPAALLSDPVIKASRPEWLTLKWRGNTNLHGGTSQIRGENGCSKKRCQKTISDLLCNTHKCESESLQK